HPQLREAPRRDEVRGGGAAGDAGTEPLREGAALAGGHPVQPLGGGSDDPAGNSATAVVERRPVGVEEGEDLLEVREELLVRAVDGRGPEHVAGPGTAVAEAGESADGGRGQQRAIAQRDLRPSAT